MLKSICTKLLISAVALALVVPAASAAAAEPAAQKQSAAAPNAALAPSARSAVLMDADSGTVIFDKNSHDRLPPASITKIMTMLLIMEALDDGRLKLTDKVSASEYASSMGGSQIFLEPGEEMSVDEMIKGIALASGNDASVAMAEKIGGSEAEFVKMMNEKAQQLGMKDTHFANCNGLPVADHYSSAHDIAIMSRELLKHTQITKYTGMYQDYLRKTSEKPFWLVNTNKLVWFYTGADGLKTGFTNEAKFCLSATARRDGLRVIAVVMGEPNTKTRNAEVSSMLDYSFAQYSNYSIFKQGDAIGKVKIEKGAVPELELKATHPYSVLMRKGASKDNIRYELKLNNALKAPIKIGDPIGRIVVYQGEQQLSEFEVQAPVSVAKAGWWTMFKRTCGGLFS
ncbi:Serine-type D-Ala-D-Ala carboxypeptidase [Paenibacillus curdlanolyticus YK9]|uniref:serine-type D-Ala-D-Ala carboxypeptidase n=1 Tax=Paenibacillus curdlanolyticus YK9 TaxID=717606 RepID=E0ICF5_9BACL|nr:Serine-type D-Ala-D-Ala carboxypeptidase [Paenibacillus curdlanolyticus YK9]